MTTPNFIYEELDTVPEQCRLCDKLLDFIGSELLSKYDAGEMTQEAVRMEITDASFDCGILPVLLVNVDDQGNETPTSQRCFFKGYRSFR